MLKVNCSLRARMLERFSKCRRQRRIIVIAYPHLHQIAEQIDFIGVQRLVLQQIHKGGKNPRLGVL